MLLEPLVGATVVSLTTLPPSLLPHLHTHKLCYSPILCLDGRHREQVPKGGAILAVVEQPHAALLPLLYGFPNDRHFVLICALALKKATARGGHANVSRRYGSIVEKSKRG